MREHHRARSRPRHHEDRGTTLIELLVTMMVFSIAMAMVYGAVLAVQQTARDLDGTSEAVSQVRAGLAQIDRQVRSGNVLYKPGDEPALLSSCTAVTPLSGTCMRVYTQANGAERCVQWQVLPDAAHPGTHVLRSRSWSTDWQLGGEVSSWRPVASGLVVPPGTAPFTLQGGSTAYQSRLLDVRLEAEDPRRDETVVLTSSLSGRNTNYGYDPGLCSPVPPA